MSTKKGAAEAIADSAKIDLSLSISDDVIPQQFISEEKDERYDEAITLEDITDSKGNPDYQKIKELMPLQIVFLGDKRKLSRIVFSSCYSPDGVLHGEWKDAEKKELKRYAITSAKVRFKISEERKEDLGFLMASFSEPSVYGSFNQKHPILFKVVSLEKEKEKEKRSINMFMKATEIINKLTTNQIHNLGLLLDIKMWKEYQETDKLSALVRIAKESPERIIAAAEDKDKELVLLFHNAKNNKIIKEKNGIFSYRSYDMGITTADVVRYLKTNEQVKDFISQELKGKEK